MKVKALMRRIICLNGIVHIQHILISPLSLSLSPVGVVALFSEMIILKNVCVYLLFIDDDDSKHLIACHLQEKQT